MLQFARAPFSQKPKPPISLLVGEMPALRLAQEGRGGCLDAGLERERQRQKPKPYSFFPPSGSSECRLIRPIWVIMKTKVIGMMPQTLKSTQASSAIWPGP